MLINSNTESVEYSVYSVSKKTPKNKKQMSNKFQFLKF